MTKQAVILCGRLSRDGRDQSEWRENNGRESEAFPKRHEKVWMDWTTLRSTCCNACGEALLLRHRARLHEPRA